ncbi:MULTISPECIES: hypothetical protein [Streptomyces]|uniref:Uncharacterized protein n=1 Tax=Streptomyces stelliscabiei TaxID=146820 RepID=A0A8I0NVT1_9ACTN|nr:MULTISPECIES: hypothetical protein [Streptomyces]MBE1594493.1 hypothetical protein [Streptomyces stelliscabiei]MDX2518850.1 hypothetical protein [Streptomyces stelliscabiei]SOD83017.1 hypothetical protein SAMN06272781_7998 [Streptomyces sp. 1222.2]
MGYAQAPAAGSLVLAVRDWMAKKGHVTCDRRVRSTPARVRSENFGTAYVRDQSTTSCP